MKKYCIKPTKKQIQIFKKYWKEIREIEKQFYNKVFELEKKISKESKILDIEIFFCDGIAGIGNYSRTMKLLQFEELEPLAVIKG